MPQFTESRVTYRDVAYKLVRGFRPCPSCKVNASYMGHPSGNWFCSTECVDKYDGYVSQVDITCPFCGEDDFDLFGLKLHLLNNWCDDFNNLVE